MDTRHGRASKRGREIAQTNGDSLLKSPNAHGRLFALGQEEELRRTLMSKVLEGLKLPAGFAEELILRAVDEVISERAGGWHLAVSPDRLRELALRLYDDLTPLLCAECVLPGCCYFDVVRLTSSDVRRLSGRFKQSRTAFVAEHCAPHVDVSDRRYVWKLKHAKPCEFLGQDQRCSVYADRPAVCAEFPFVVDKQTGELTEIRLFPFCNVTFNAVRCEVARRVEKSVRIV